MGETWERPAELINTLSAKRQLLLELSLKEMRVGAGSGTIPRKNKLDPAVLSFGQERLWFLDQLQPDSAVYNIPMGLRLGGALNVPVLQRCLNEVLRRHESLRTSFETVEGQPVQAIQPAASMEMPLVDLTESAKAGAGSGGQAIVRGRGATSF